MVVLLSANVQLIGKKTTQPLAHVRRLDEVVMIGIRNHRKFEISADALQNLRQPDRLVQVRVFVYIAMPNRTFMDRHVWTAASL